MTYSWICDKSNRMDATSGTEHVYYSEAHKLTFCFCGVGFAQSFVLFCVLSILIFSVFVFLAIILYVLDRFTAYNYFYDMS